ncbi:hypothetical protein Ddc_12369 [Ditylenchus destructor]|nr:hypothetical protein Ddc_12369 [Ditylenchus destructor]
MFWFLFQLWHCSSLGASSRVASELSIFLAEHLMHGSTGPKSPDGSLPLEVLSTRSCRSLALSTFSEIPANDPCPRKEAPMRQSVAILPFLLTVHCTLEEEIVFGVNVD